MLVVPNSRSQVRSDTELALIPMEWLPSTYSSSLSLSLSRDSSTWCQPVPLPALWAGTKAADSPR
eukprot:185881-Prorocentrum_minimum.AAC.1